MYQKEFKDGRKKNDIIYGVSGGKYLLTTPPALVEIQQKVDIQFLKRLTRYCLNIHDQTKIEPVVMVFAIQGSSSKAFIEDNFNQSQNKAYYTSKKFLWAKACRFYSLDSIANVMSENTMKPVVALTYFLCNQKKSLFGLEKSEDPELRRIYQIAARSFEPYTTKEEENYNHIMDTMKNTSSQFQKISKCIDELKRSKTDTILEKIKRYAEDGFEYTKKKIKIIEEEDEDGTITPIENVITADSHFVIKLRKEPGKFSWEECYKKGSSQGLFNRFKSHLTLKDAFHKKTL
ncbi:hypothetical protein CU098_006834 [Rhizopus stolonifer]|uniref:Uncharacterized protein n=1 Tax=Rhizopus stolonifer TaxID=4846 RepID=A0A367IU85_RHIST|nr:hypothetical protein CU098_006834 [Rhizopus stolonifer]